jgi:hypothetical protein
MLAIAARKAAGGSAMVKSRRLGLESLSLRELEQLQKTRVSRKVRKSEHKSAHPSELPEL